jgi:hypothetical protein
MSFDYAGEGLIKCHACGAMVPSFESLIGTGAYDALRALNILREA